MLDPHLRLSKQGVRLTVLKRQGAESLPLGDPPKNMTWMHTDAHKLER